jgi:hypothetical protein
MDVVSVLMQKYEVYFNIYQSDVVNIRGLTQL